MTEKLKEMNKLEQRVFMLLPKGINRLISAQEIEDIIDIDKRYIMEIIEKLVIEYRIPIGSFRNSDNFGYFIATNEQEKLMGTHSLNQQVNTMKKRLSRVKAADFKTTDMYREKYKDVELKKDMQLDLLYSFKKETTEL